jgi:hypothetical protein
MKIDVAAAILRGNLLPETAAATTKTLAETRSASDSSFFVN